MAILDLSWNEIEGNLPSSLGQLQLLQKMDLSSDRLTGKIPADVGNLKRLVLLDLSQNFIGGPILESLLKLELLEYPIKSEIPHFIGNLSKPKSVSFSGCGLIGFIPNSFSSLKNLTAVSLDNNSLSGSVPPNLALLPNLDQLNINHNMLNKVLQLHDEFIGKLGKRLDIRGNSELWISDQPNKKNLSSYLEIPFCVSMKPRNGTSFAKGQPEDPTGIEPSLYQSNISSSSSSWLDLQVIFIP